MGLRVDGGAAVAMVHQVDGTTSGVVNNYALNQDTTHLTLKQGGALDWRGMAAPSPAKPRTVFIRAVGLLTPANESGTSTAANRLIVPAACIAGGNGWVAWYDPDASRWFITAYQSY